MGEKMRSEVKGNVKNSIGRIAFAALAVLIQILWIIVLMVWLNNYSSIISVVMNLIAFAVALRIYGKHTNAAFKMPWIIVMLALPVLGLCLYGLFGHKEAMKRIIRRFDEVDAELFPLLAQDEEVLSLAEKKDPYLANQCRYIQQYSGFPLYRADQVDFYPEASEGFEAQLSAMRDAKQFIFMEYHAIEEAQAFARMTEILGERAAAGVEVRILYDDVGSIGFLDKSFIARMEAIGVQCRVFNYVVPFLNIFMNNRDHRKILVVDGRIAFTGGYNLADEYFNITHPYGYWKDTGISVTGDAVNSMTVMFLEMWNSMGKTDTDFARYLCGKNDGSKDGRTTRGFVQPYADTPLDEEPVGENVYLNLIKCAKKRLYVATPYLIISDEMDRELGLAAKRGVDVRIFTPGIPDKKIIYGVTRSYYGGLVRQGVRIYEYTPGFLHSKHMLCDEDTATVGTINMDYRSLYHHFENGVWMHGVSAVRDVEADFEHLLRDSKEVTEDYKSLKKTAIRGLRCVLRLFAPLM